MPDGTEIDYVIDGQNRRVGKKRNGVLEQGFLYQGRLNPVAELNGNNIVTARFVYGDRRNVPAYIIKGGINYRIVTDHLGSVRLVVNSQTGEVAQRMDYDAWGNVIEDTNPSFQPFGYAGGIYDRDTGLTRLGARDYDPESGRWTTKGPIGFNGGLNHYGYVHQNPINLFDPTGNAAQFICFAFPYGTGASVLVAVGTYVSVDNTIDGVKDLQQASQSRADYYNNRNDAYQCMSNGNCTPEEIQQLNSDASQNYSDFVDGFQSGASSIASSVPGTSMTGPLPVSGLDAVIFGTGAIVGEMCGFE